MKTKYLNFPLLIILLIITVFNVSQAQGYAGIISVDSAVVQRGEHFSLPVRLSNNDKDISGLVIPLHYSGTALTVDSVSFVGSLLDSNFIPGAQIGQDSNFIQIGQDSNFIQIVYLPKLHIPLVPLSSPNGIIATIFFAVASDAAPGMVIIDSVNNSVEIGPGVFVQTNIQLSDPTGTITYRPRFIKGGVNVLLSTGVNDGDNTALPDEFNLAQNYPNPFNPTTVIVFSLPRSGFVKLEVFNVLGQKISTLVNGFMDAGNHQVEFDASRQPSGVYFYRLNQNNQVETKKMILMK